MGGLQRLKKCYFRLSLVMLVLLCQACTFLGATNTPPSTAARVVVLDGRAAISNGSTLLARKQAIQDAIRQAFLQVDAKANQDAVKMASESSLAAAVSAAQILDERVAADYYTVRVKVNLASDAVCTAQQRKRMVATAFPLVEASQVASAETHDLYSGIPRELSNALMASKDFVTHDATQITLYEQPAMAPELAADAPYQPSSVLQIAKAHGAQLVLSGVIRDMQIESGDYITGSGPMGMAKSWLHAVWSRRGIGLDVYVHDGFTGALLLQNRYQAAAEGDVWVPANYTVGSERFNATTTGAKIAGMIEQASTDIRRSLSCYPFATRVIKIEGSQLFVDAGAQENLHTGEQLVVYSEASGGRNLEGGNRYAEQDKRPVGVLTLNDIRTRYAIGTLDVSPAKAGVKVGDWVKSW
jgi:hypothetical protein